VGHKRFVPIHGRWHRRTDLHLPSLLEPCALELIGDKRSPNQQFYIYGSGRHQLPTPFLQGPTGFVKQCFKCGLQTTWAWTLICFWTRGCRLEIRRDAVLGNATSSVAG
jgi:hypothetical protein